MKLVRINEDTEFNPYENEDEDLSWLELDHLPDEDTMFNPLLNYSLKDPPKDPVADLVGILADRNYLHLAAKLILNVELMPFQLLMLDTLWNKRLPILVASRGASKTFILAVYSLLRLIFHPGCRVIIVGAAFRQSKQMHDYMVTIWQKAPILRDIAGRGGGPKRETDRCEMWIGDSSAYALPLGDGTRIRGLRGNYIIGDEFASIPEDIFNLVVQGFGVVSSNPVDKVKQAALINKLKEMGAWTEEMEELRKKNVHGNQIIYSGTASYAFNHFAKYHRKWHTIISSKGDPHKLKDLFGENEGSMEGFDWKDYAILRIPYTCLPKDYLDQGILAQARATLHKSQFFCEYCACLSEGQEIITNHGLKKIKDISLGDMVLTHKGRFRPVTKLMNRISDHIYKIKTYGSNQPIMITEEHPFWTGGDNWISAKLIEGKTKLSNLKELNGLKEIKLSDYSDNLSFANIDEVEYIYPNWSNYGTTYNMGNRKYKSFLKNSIEVGYDLGIMVGYYASEGSTGSDGRSIDFALDGHKDIALEYYVKELSDSILNIVGKNPKHYYRKSDNTMKVTINSRIMVDFFKSICPGISDTKLINTKLLYSNEEFLKGFITGYWHGDGCVHCGRNDVYKCVAGCVNKPLLSQIRVALSFFNISCSLDNCKNRKKSVFRGKICETKDFYTMQVYGENCYKLINLINNNDICKESNNKFVFNDGNSSNFRIISKERLSYNDYVYNIEVEEDHSYSLVNATVHNCFASDSDGFYRRSILESATTNEPILISSGQTVQFSALKQGLKDRVYAIGVDPAAEADNAAIVVLELHKDHRRIVHCWTTNRKKYNQLKNTMKSSGVEMQDDYYRYIAKKIRLLMRDFNIERIIMDKGGGGIAIQEALSSRDTCDEGETPIYLVIDPEDPQPCDIENGLHILELLVPTSQINSDSNHGMLKDLQDKVLLFPMFDTIEIERSLVMDKQNNVTFDTYEDLVFEIEELKTEMTTISVTQSSTLGREVFDTPQIKTEGQKKGRLRKDRYSALLYANYYARNRGKDEALKIDYKAVGGTRDSMKHTSNTTGSMYRGPGIFKFSNGSGKKWITGGANTNVVRRKY